MCTRRAQSPSGILARLLRAPVPGFDEGSVTPHLLCCLLCVCTAGCQPRARTVQPACSHWARTCLHHGCQDSCAAVRWQGSAGTRGLQQQQQVGMRVGTCGSGRQLLLVLVVANLHLLAVQASLQLQNTVVSYNTQLACCAVWLQPTAAAVLPGCLAQPSHWAVAGGTWGRKQQHQGQDNTSSCSSCEQLKLGPPA